MRTSIKVCGALVAGMDAILGANVMVKRFEMRRGFQVTDMESGKLRSSKMSMSSEERRPSIRPLVMSSFLRISPKPSASPNRLHLASIRYKSRIKITTTETQYPDMISKLRSGKCKDCRCKEHGFVVRMRN